MEVNYSVPGPIVSHAAVFTLCELHAEGGACRFVPITSFMVLLPYSGRNESSVTRRIENL
jgi:hypothetical protein